MPRTLEKLQGAFGNKQSRSKNKSKSFRYLGPWGDHVTQSGHAASLEDFSVLDRANNDFDLLIHESLLILRDRPSLNSQQSSIALALF